MSRFGKIISLAVLAVAAAALGLGSLVFIRPAEASSTTTVTLHGGRGFCGQAGLEAAAEKLGLTSDELSTKLWGGESLSSLAEEAGVDLQEVQDTVNAACVTATREAIEQAVADGTISREKADWLLEGLDKGFWGGNEGGLGLSFGFGRRGGFGGFHGFRQLVPKATATPGSGA